MGKTLTDDLPLHAKCVLRGERPADKPSQKLTEKVRAGTISLTVQTAGKALSTRHLGFPAFSSSGRPNPIRRKRRSSKFIVNLSLRWPL